MPVGAAAVRLRAQDGTERVILVRSIEQDPLLPGNVLLRGAAGVCEEDYPNLIVVDWSIPKDLIVAYTVGELTPVAPRVVAQGWVPGQ